MCRALSKGGRRCPCDQPERRSAYRKASRAAAGLTPIGEGGAVVVLNDAPPDLLEVWQPARVTELAETIQESLRYAPVKHVGDGESLSDEELDVAYRKHLAAKDAVQEMGGAEAAVRTVGEAVAQEAERRAGVTAEQIQAMSATYIERETAALAAAKAETERLDAEFKNLPEAQAFRDAAERMRNAHGAEAREVARQAHTAAFHTYYNHPVFVERGKAQERAAVHARNLVSGITPETQEALTRLSDAYVDVLKETRQLGGVKSQWDAKTTKKAAAAFEQTMQIFPADWIEKHNARTPVLARISGRRAHYSDGTIKTERKKVRDKSYFHMRNDSDVLPENSAWDTYRQPTEEEAERFYQHSPKTGSRTLYIHEEWDVDRPWGGFNEDSPPRGRGWEMYEHPGTGNKYWRRPKYSWITANARVVPEITTNADQSPVKRGDEFFSTSSHEMVHRFEAAMPEMGKLESAFLQRRTSDENGERHSTTALYGGRKHKGRVEVTREDDFVNAYIGKEYRSGTYHEVATMGTQMLFSGDNGGLVGAGRYKADTDMRAFVLGLFATVGRPRQSS